MSIRTYEDALVALANVRPDDGELVLGPEQAVHGYWAGSPGVTYEPAANRFLLTYRYRRPREHTDGDRGWRCAIAQSSDGVHFEDLWAVEKTELASASMERFCLTPTPSGYRLYVTYVDPDDSRWRIDKLDAPAPEHFDVTTRSPVLTAANTGTEGVKDPYVYQDGETTYLYASFAQSQGFNPDKQRFAHATADIYNVGVTICPTGLAISQDGEAFAWQGTALDVGTGWDHYQARITTVLASDAGYIAFYDGSASVTENYEEHCGLAASSDLLHWHSLSPDVPALLGAHGTRSVRYLDVVTAEDATWAYYEIARADGAHELRRHQLPGVAG